MPTMKAPAARASRIIERAMAFRQATWPEREALHRQMAERKADQLEARRELGRAYLARESGGCEVSREKAVERLNLPAETHQAREEAFTMAEGRPAHRDNGSLEYPLVGSDFPADSAAVELAASPLLLAPIVRYLGMLPVLVNIFVTRALATELRPDTPHRFHLDPEDVTSFKVFIHLTDVDEDCGPMHVLPADATQTVLRTVGYRDIDKVADEKVDELVGWDAVVKSLGPPGTVALADTTRCLHCGGRPRAPGKPVRYVLVFQYLLPTSPLFPVDGDDADPAHLPNLEPTGDDHWDALIGAKLT